VVVVVIVEVLLFDVVVMLFGRLYKEVEDGKFYSWDGLGVNSPFLGHRLLSLMVQD
jgi:hypothetical protein